MLSSFHQFREALAAMLSAAVFDFTVSPRRRRRRRRFRFSTLMAFSPPAARLRFHVLLFFTVIFSAAIFCQLDAFRF